MVRSVFLFTLFFWILSSDAYATFSIPTKMSSHDRGTALSILGYGSAVKILDNPYPMGGYSGVEVGLSTEFINTQQIAKLGNGTSAQAQTSYNVLSFGKGLYRNVDVFAQFSYLGQTEAISNFGGQIRWGFYEAQNLPIFASLNVHGDSTNFNNLIVTNDFGFDILGGITEGDATVYLGFGMLRAMGTFSGGTNGVTDTNQTEQTGILDNRILGGLSVKMGQQAFVAAEIDSYSLPVYSAKLGLRF